MDFVVALNYSTTISDVRAALSDLSRRYHDYDEVRGSPFDTQFSTGLLLLETFTQKTLSTYDGTLEALLKAVDWQAVEEREAVHEDSQ